MASNVSQWRSSTMEICEITIMHIPTDTELVELKTAVAIINIIISLFGTLANGLVIMAYYRNSRLRTIQNTIFFLLAITDFGVTAIVEPIYVAAIFGILEGRRSCLLWDISAALSVLFVQLSLVTIVSLSLQSYITLAFPYHWQSLVTKSRFNMVIVFSWLFVLFFTVSFFRRGEIMRYTQACILFLSISTVIFTWCWTYKLVARHRQAIRTTQTLSTNANTSRRKILRSTITAFVIIASLLMCYLLTLCFLFFGEFITSPNDYTYGILWSLSRTLMYLNSLINPCLVFWRSTPFKETAKNILN